MLVAVSAAMWITREAGGEGVRTMRKDDEEAFRLLMAPARHGRWLPFCPTLAAFFRLPSFNMINTSGTQ